MMIRSLFTRNVLFNCSNRLIHSNDSTKNLPFQLTLAILKPDISCCDVWCQQIKETILQNNFLVIRSKRMHLTMGQAESFYSEHKDKFFYTRLTAFMVSGPIEVFIMGRPNGIEWWRNMLGPTKVYKTQYENRDTIRGQYGLTDTRNVGHGSDSVESANKEITFFFPDFDPIKWMATEKKDPFVEGNVEFDVSAWVHRPLKKRK